VRQSVLWMLQVCSMTLINDSYLYHFQGIFWYPNSNIIVIVISHGFAMVFLAHHYLLFLFILRRDWPIEIIINNDAFNILVDVSAPLILWYHWFMRDTVTLSKQNCEQYIPSSC
jgi:hypothetical protein